MKKNCSLFKKYIFLAILLISSTQEIKAMPPNKGNSNSGNDCFLNATVQALFHLKPFREFLDWAKTNNIYASNSMPQALIDHVNVMAGNSAVTPPQAFRTIFCSTSSNDDIKKMLYGQHDAQEFYSSLIDRLEEDGVSNSNQKPVKQEISTLFNIPINHVLVCPVNSAHSGAEKPRPGEEKLLSLSLEPNCRSLENLLKQYRGGTKLICHSCNPSNPNNFYANNNEPFDQFKITSLPNILTVQFKRFAYNWSTGETTKINNLYSIPEKLSSNPETLMWDGNFDYVLSAIVIQSGDLSSGHYWAYGRWYNNSKWYYYNDMGDKARVADANEMNTLLNPSDLENKSSAPTPYLLFYVKTKKPAAQPPVVPTIPPVPVKQPEPEKSNLTTEDQNLVTKLTGLSTELKKFDNELTALKTALENLKNVITTSR